MNNPEPLKIGDRVIHKLTGQKMTVKKISGGIGSIVTCVKEIPEPYKFGGIKYPGDIAICIIQNLEKL